MAAASTSGGLFAVLLDELRPYDGRLSASLRLALCCGIVVLIAMSQHVPEAALSCYLIFFASRDNAASGILIALALIVAASVGILLGLVFLQLAADEPMLRLIFMVAFTFGGMYLSQATKAGPIAATVGFVFAFVMTLNDFVPIPELLSRGLSWMWVVVFFPMATLVLINALIGPNPALLARRAVAERLRAAAALLAGERQTRAYELLAKAPTERISTARLAALLGFHSRIEAQRLATILPMGQNILVQALAGISDRELSCSLEDLADAVEHRRRLPDGWRPRSKEADNALLLEAITALDAVWDGQRHVGTPAAARTKPADTWTNPVYLQFALKSLLAVFITYGIYTARDWFEIHTAMITCFYVALGSTGETLHKAGLRIVGCLIGAAMGIASIVFLMPHMTDIGHLILLVCAGSFIAAWVANGSSLIQYMGWQMALAFFLCVLQGYGPAFDIDVATNRILGILVGNAVVTIVFLWLWPVSVSSQAAQHLANALHALAASVPSGPSRLAAVETEVDEAKRLVRLSAFEASRLRMRSAMLPHARQIMAATQAALPLLAQLQGLRARRRYYFGAPRCVRAATTNHEASIVRFLDLAASSIVAPAPEAKAMLQRSLADASDTLHALDRRLAKAPPRASWREDLSATAEAHRRLLAGFTQVVEHL